MTTDVSEVHPFLDALHLHVDSFLDHLHTLGYAPQSVVDTRSIVVAFARWSESKRIVLDEITEEHLAAFAKRRAFRPRTPVELRALRKFLKHLRVERGLPPQAGGGQLGPVDELTERYRGYLLADRGLAKNSALVYVPCVHHFLAYRFAKTGSLALETLDAETIRAFLVERIAPRSSESARLLSIALRSFLRFLFLRGETSRDLSPAVPMVRTYQQSGVPAVLSAEEIERVLAVTDRSTTRGRRDHAILLLLARLGLRAGEIASLELNDVDWRAAEIVVRGKGAQLDRVPLLADVGQAIASYLQDRGASVSRRIFLRLIPPRVGLSGPAAIDHMVRLALTRASVRPVHRRVSHLFRHSLATRMIRHGASISEIAEVLRHRSQSTTAVYAKVSFDVLRTVARPWPTGGGAR